jgi:hypothetical protein
MMTDFPFQGWYEEIDSLHVIPFLFVVKYDVRVHEPDLHLSS